MRSIAEDHSGSLWFGTFAGLNRMDARTRNLTVYRHNPADPQSLSHDDVPSLFVDHQGVLWAGTMDGLDAFDPATGSFRVYRQSGAGLNQYLVIAEDSHGTLWLGTLFAGLQRFDPATGHFSYLSESTWNWWKPEQRSSQYNLHRPLGNHLDRDAERAEPVRSSDAIIHRLLRARRAI